MYSSTTPRVPTTRARVYRHDGFRSIEFPPVRRQFQVVRSSGREERFGDEDRDVRADGERDTVGGAA
jgi:hypothetical protein